MKSLVTGGRGFLGRYIVEALLREGHDVTVLCRGSDPELERMGVRVISADIRDRAAVLRACRGMDQVFHAAAKCGPWGRYTDFYSTNVVGTQHVIDACVAQGVGKLIYTSTPSVVGGLHDLSGVNEAQPFPRRKVNGYQHSKMLAEQLVIAAHGRQGLATTALRPHAIWGPRDAQLFPILIARHRAGRLFRIGAGRNKVSVSYVENAAWAHLQAAGSERTGGRVYFVNEPEPVCLWPWIDGLFASIGLPPVRRQVPYSAAYTLGAVSELAHTLIPALGEARLTRVVAAACAKDHYFDISAAQRDFGLYSPVSMPEGMLRFARYFSAPPPSR